jgi:hypothetical protein
VNHERQQPAELEAPRDPMARWFSEMFALRNDAYLLFRRVEALMTELPPITLDGHGLLLQCRKQLGLPKHDDASCDQIRDAAAVAARLFEDTARFFQDGMTAFLTRGERWLAEQKGIEGLLTLHDLPDGAVQLVRPATADLRTPPRCMVSVDLVPAWLSSALAQKCCAGGLICLGWAHDRSNGAGDAPDWVPPAWVLMTGILRLTAEVRQKERQRQQTEAGQ